MKALKNKKKLYKWTLSRIPQKRWADPKSCRASEFCSVR